MENLWLAGENSVRQTGTVDMDTWLTGSRDVAKMVDVDGFEMLAPYGTSANILSSTTSSDIEVLSSVDLTEDLDEDGLLGNPNYLTLPPPSDWLENPVGNLIPANNQVCEERMALCHFDQGPVITEGPEDPGLQDQQTLTASPQWKLTVHVDGSGMNPEADTTLMQPTSTSLAPDISQWLTGPKNPDLLEELKNSPILKYFLWLREDATNKWLQAEGQVYGGEHVDPTPRVPTLGLYNSMDTHGQGVGFGAKPIQGGPENQSYEKWLLPSNPETISSPHIPQDPRLNQWLMSDTDGRMGHVTLTSPTFARGHADTNNLNRWVYEKDKPAEQDLLTVFKNLTVTSDSPCYIEPLSSFDDTDPPGLSIKPGGRVSNEPDNLFQCFIGAHDNTDLQTWYKE